MPPPLFTISSFQEIPRRRLVATRDVLRFDGCIFTMCLKGKYTCDTPSPSPNKPFWYTMCGNCLPHTVLLARHILKLEPPLPHSNILGCGRVWTGHCWMWRSICSWQSGGRGLKSYKLIWIPFLCCFTNSHFHPPPQALQQSGNPEAGAEQLNLSLELAEKGGVQALRGRALAALAACGGGLYIIVNSDHIFYFGISNNVLYYVTIDSLWCDTLCTRTFYIPN